MTRLYSLGTHLASRGGNEQEGKVSEAEGWPVTRGWHSELCGPQGQGVGGGTFQAGPCMRFTPWEFGKRDFSISHKLETTDLTRMTTEILWRSRRGRMVWSSCFR